MQHRALTAAIEGLRQRLADLEPRAKELVGQPEVLTIATLAELVAALEELEVAAEEVRRQNEALVAARQAVEAGRQRYRELFEFAPDGYLVTDTQGVIQEANRAAAALLNVTSHALVGTPLAAFLTPSDHQLLQTCLSQLQAGAPMGQWQVDIHLQDGGAFPAALTGAGAYDPEGRLVGLRWCLRDVTERRKAEQALQRAQADLEQRVEARTAELRAINESLQREIAERRRVVAALRESEAKYRRLVEQVPAVTYMAAIDEVGSTLYVSPQIETLLGFTQKEWIADPELWSKRLHPADRERVRAESVDHWASDGQFHDEYRLFARDGRIVWVRDEAVTVRDDAGRLLCLQGVMLDITARKRTEWRLSAQYAVSRVLTEAVTLDEAAARVLQVIGEALAWEVGTFWMLDRETNDLFCHTTWRSPSFPAGKFEAVSRQARFAAGVGFPGRVLATGEPAWGVDVLVESRFLRHQIAGSEGLRGAVFFPVRGGNGVLGVMEFFSREVQRPDEGLLQTMVTLGNHVGQFIERVRAEEALAASEHRFRALIENSSDMMVLIDRAGTITYASPSTQRAFGYSPEEVIGRSVFEVLEPDDVETAQRLFDALVQHPEELIRAEFLIRGKDRAPRWIEIAASNLLEEPGVEAIVVNYRDITERKQAEEALRQREQEFRTLAENAPDIIARFDRQLRHTYINSAIAEIASVPPETFIGKTNREMGMPEDLVASWEEALQQLFETGRAGRIELTFPGPDGTTYFESRLIPETAPGGAIESVLVIARDITARKRAEEALRESEERFRRLAENAEDIIYRYRLTPPRGFEYVSPAATAITGYTPEEHYADPELGFKLVHADDRELLRRQTADGANLGQPVILRWVCKDGAPIWTEQRNVPIYDDAGNLVALEGIARDITDRKRAEEALVQERNLLRTLIDNLPDYIFVKDTESRFVVNNVAHVRLLGATTPEEVAGKTDFDFLPKKLAEYYAADDRAVIRSGQRLVNREQPAIDRTGNLTLISTTKVPLRDRRGQIVGLVAIARDITAQKRVEHTLREAEARYRSIFENAIEGIFQTTVDGRQGTGNPALARLLGYDSIEEMLAEPGDAAQLYVDPGDRQALIALVDAVGAVTDFETRLRRKDGAQLWVAVNARALRDSSGRLVGLQGMLLDITERKRAEEERARHAAQLQGLADASLAINASLSLDDILRVITEKAREIIAVHMAATSLTVDQNWAQTLRHVSLSEKYSAWREWDEQPQGLGIYRLVCQQNRSMRMTQAELEAHPQRHGCGPGMHPPLRGWLAAPLVGHDGRNIGLIQLSDKYEGEFSANDEAILVQLAQVASSAIENARLHEAERRRATDLARSNTLITALGRVASRLEIAPDPDAVMETLGAELRELGVTCLVTFLETESQAMVIRYTSLDLLTLERFEKVAEIKVRGFRIQRERFPVYAEIVEHRRPLFLADPIPLLVALLPQASTRVIKRLVRLAGLKPGIPAIRLPLVAKERMLGTLWVWGASLQEADVPAFSVFAGQAAIAIENARLFEQVRAGRERLQTLSRRLVEIQESQRRDIARELHDEVGQVLTGLKLLLEMSARPPADAVQANLAEAQVLLDDLMGRVRELSLDLRPPMLDDLGLLPALLWHFDRYTSQTQVRVRFEHSGVERRFGSEIETAVYRIIQEALTNVARHARVPQVTVRLWADHERLGVQIEDQGAGFDPEEALRAGISSGLIGMYERAVLLGGHLAVESVPGVRTRLTAELPLADAVIDRRKEGRQA